MNGKPMSDSSFYERLRAADAIKAKLKLMGEADERLRVSALDTQEGGDHYKKLGEYQPWEVLKRWLTPEEFRGYMKGSAIAYLAREQGKGGMLDIRKAAHTLQALAEMQGDAA